MSQTERTGGDLNEEQVVQEPTYIRITEEQLFEQMDRTSEEVLKNIARMFSAVKQLDQKVDEEQQKNAKHEQNQADLMKFCKNKFPEVWEEGRKFGWKTDQK